MRKLAVSLLIFMLPLLIIILTTIYAVEDYYSHQRDHIEIMTTLSKIESKIDSISMEINKTIPIDSNRVMDLQRFMRYDAACHAMAGLIMANDNNPRKNDKTVLTGNAWRYADALIEFENYYHK